MPDRILLFGNSGAGKSTLARRLGAARGVAHLDLDTLAWQATMPPRRSPIEESATEIDSFTQANGSWVIEGCYTDLLELLADRATEIIWLNPPVETCVENARGRPWESHKYATKEAQDANLDMLISWIRDYVSRDDTFSFEAHRRFFRSFPGKRREISSNEEAAALS